MIDAIIGKNGSMANVGIGDDDEKDVEIFMDQKTTNSEFLTYVLFFLIFCGIIYFGKFLPEPTNLKSVKHSIRNDSFYGNRNDPLFYMEDYRQDSRYKHRNYYDSEMGSQRPNNFSDIYQHFPQNFLANEGQFQPLSYTYFSHIENGLRSLFKSVEFWLKFTNIPLNSSFYFNITAEFTFQPKIGKYRYKTVVIEKNITKPSQLDDFEIEINEEKQLYNLSLFIIRDSCINYTRIDSKFYLATSEQAKEVYVITKRGNPAFHSLFMWLNINLPLILCVIVVIRLFKCASIAKEQFYCTILSIATIMFDKPLEMVRMFMPDYNMIVLSELMHKIYPSFLFFYIVHIFARCFNYNVNLFVELVVVNFFIFNIFFAYGDIKENYPSCIPNRNGIVSPTISQYVNETLLYGIGIVFLFIYVIALRSTGVEEHARRFKVYITIAIIFSAAYVSYFVLLTNTEFENSVYAAIFPYSLVNVLAFVLEYFHSDFTPTIDQIYVSPGEKEISENDDLGILINDQEIDQNENDKKELNPNMKNIIIDDDDSSPSAQGTNSNEA